MSVRPVFLISDNLSHAWVAAFRVLMLPGVRSLQPLVVVLTGFDEEGLPYEDWSVRTSLDVALDRNGTRLSVESVANTIFPHSFWRPGVPRQRFFERYRRLQPRLKRKDRRNSHGRYFDRLIGWGTERPPGGNQLEHILHCYADGVRRKPALQASTFDPARDLTLERRRGFPCLQQVAFAPDTASGTLSLSAFYASQYVFERAYGNYLGLCRLGRFMAHEMGLRLTKMTCYAGYATVGDVGRIHLRQLLQAVAAVPEIRHVEGDQP